jgi:hypothetical protein
MKSKACWLSAITMVASLAVVQAAGQAEPSLGIYKGSPSALVPQKVADSTLDRTKPLFRDAYRRSLGTLTDRISDGLSARYNYKYSKNDISLSVLVFPSAELARSALQRIVGSTGRTRLAVINKGQKKKGSAIIGDRLLMIADENMDGTVCWTNGSVLFCVDADAHPNGSEAERKKSIDVMLEFESQFPH